MNAQPWEVPIAHLQGAFEQVNERIGDLVVHMDGRFAQVDARFAQVDARFVQVDARLDSLDQKIDRKVDGLQWRMTALIVGTWITTMLAVIFHR